ncbi:MAG: NUDIX hydrolase, partial [Gammaproteobacteria bacterium]|nr:NUDIX hydrolase [Gammaproteobacteria bacterium]
ATLKGGYGVGAESLETKLFAEDEIPWNDLAFRSGKYALKKYLQDRRDHGGENRGVHIHELRRAKL